MGALEKMQSCATTSDDDFASVDRKWNGWEQRLTFYYQYFRLWITTTSVPYTLCNLQQFNLFSAVLMSLRTAWDCIFSPKNSDRKLSMYTKIAAFRTLYSSYMTRMCGLTYVERLWMMQHTFQQICSDRLQHAECINTFAYSLSLSVFIVAVIWAPFADTH